MHGSWETDVHETMIALRMIPRQAYILIHVERDYVFEREFVCFHEADEVLVGGDGGGPGGETEHEVWVTRCWCKLGDPMGDVGPNVCPDGGGVVADDEPWGKDR